MEFKSLLERLNYIQTSLKAPKGQLNNFGKYKYRSCEDILESVKPLLKDTGCVLTIKDDIIQIGDRYYVKAIATIYCSEEKEIVSAFAREPENKKGMDEAQITGATSSYARKYALNGLFCIDDTKDADTEEKGEAKRSTKQALPAPKAKDEASVSQTKVGAKGTEKPNSKQATETTTPPKLSDQEKIKVKIKKLNDLKTLADWNEYTEKDLKQQYNSLGYDFEAPIEVTANLMNKGDYDTLKEHFNVPNSERSGSIV